MTDQDRKETSALTIVEAVETLSNIADLQIGRNIGIAEEDEIGLEDNSLSVHTVNWLKNHDTNLTMDLVRDIFRVILNYLRHFYNKEQGQIQDQQALEGIKTIMVLVGEAAKKLDKYTHLFHATQNKSVTELREYKKLQEFYLSKIDRKIDEGLLGKWILALSQKTKAYTTGNLKLTGIKNETTKHVFVDLESVKKDTEYELFFLRKEDGTRFFSPRLIRNIKLVRDFGDYLGEEKRDDPLLQAQIWFDRAAHISAKNIIRATHRDIAKFYQESMNFKERELIDALNKSLMAVMLAANSHNLSHNVEIQIKNCGDYFGDFQYYLRKCLHCREYQHMIAYPPQKSSKFAIGLLNTIHKLCMALYTQTNGMQELLSMIHMILQKAHQNQPHLVNDVKVDSLSIQLNNDYKAMAKLLKLHPNGPVNKILNALEEGQYHEFDPLIQGNVPSQLFTLYTPESKCIFARWPSPTHQEFINKAPIIDEFKAFLRACVHEHGLQKCLVINFQDRLTWKEHPRSASLEELEANASFDKHIAVVTIAKDTEFYHQLASYQNENHAEVFIQTFKDHLRDENCGYFFPEWMHKPLLNEFVDEAMEAVHRVFFGQKNVLTREQRLDFIEIFYLFLQLKIVELAKADVVGFCCKDGLDISLTAGAQMFILWKFLSQERLSEIDREYLDLMLYGPCLLFRERALLLDRFQRMKSMITVLETARENCGQANFVKTINEAFGKCFHTAILHGKVLAQPQINEL